MSKLAGRHTRACRYSVEGTGRPCDECELEPCPQCGSVERYGHAHEQYDVCEGCGFRGLLKSGHRALLDLLGDEDNGENDKA